MIATLRNHCGPRTLILLPGLLWLVACDPGRQAGEASSIVLSILSNQSGLISGGDALVRATYAPDLGPEGVVITLNGRDVSLLFADEIPGVSLLGRVTGLLEGENRRAAHLVAGDATAQPVEILITNHALTGPILSGPDGALRPLPPGNRLPADVAFATTLHGASVPLVVRLETGTMNRGIYPNALLHDPTTQPDIGPLAPPRGWNRRLIALHGSGCSGGWYVQGDAYTSLQVADAFPGLFDGVHVSCTYPDALAIALAGLDARLLANQYLNGNPGPISLG